MPEIEYPITVNKIAWNLWPSPVKPPLLHSDDVGKFVAVRPCTEDDEKRTYLGVLLGDLPTHIGATLDGDGTLTIVQGLGNPAIWVPDLKKVVMGYESWWGVIKGPDDLRQITDKDIESIWYVKALKELAKEAGEQTP